MLCILLTKRLLIYLLTSIIKANQEMFWASLHQIFLSSGFYQLRLIFCQNYQIWFWIKIIFIFILNLFSNLRNDYGQCGSPLLVQTFSRLPYRNPTYVIGQLIHSINTSYYGRYIDNMVPLYKNEASLLDFFHWLNSIHSPITFP